jgi:hypothetical protein
MRSEDKKAPKFQVKRETVRRLDREELSVVAGGRATAACCIGCDTTATHTGDASFCLSCLC